jgi:hypothetical protein
MAQLRLGGEGRMGAEVSVFAKPLEMRLGDAVDDLRIDRRVFDDHRFELEQSPDVVCGRRSVPCLDERCSCYVAERAQLAVLGDQIIDERDPCGGQRGAQGAGFVGLHRTEKIDL